MIHSQKSSVKNLSEWLEIATGKLVPSARARVRAEIEAHYAEAVRVRKETGISEADAQMAALADLGRARVAARRFSHQYLTQNDAHAIMGIYKRSTRDHLLGCVFLVLLFSMDWLAHPEKTSTCTTLFGLAVLYALDLPGVYFTCGWPRSLAGIDPPPTSLQHLLWKHFAANLTLGFLCLMLVLFFHRADSVVLSSVLIILVVFTPSCLKLLRLLRKCEFSELKNLI